VHSGCLPPCAPCYSALLFCDPPDQARAGTPNPRPGQMRLPCASGACISQRDGLACLLVTVLRAEGPRVVIFVDDHQPAHVHVLGDGQARINLTGAGGTPELVWAYGMTRGEVRRAMRIVVEQRAVLLARWESIHGRPD